MRAREHELDARGRIRTSGWQYVLEQGLRYSLPVLIVLALLLVVAFGARAGEIGGAGHATTVRAQGEIVETLLPPPGAPRESAARQQAEIDRLLPAAAPRQLSATQRRPTRATVTPVQSAPLLPPLPSKASKTRAETDDWRAYMFTPADAGIATKPRTDAGTTAASAKPGDRAKSDDVVQVAAHPTPPVPTNWRSFMLSDIGVVGMNRMTVSVSNKPEPTVIAQDLPPLPEEADPAQAAPVDGVAVAESTPAGAFLGLDEATPQAMVHAPDVQIASLPDVPPAGTAAAMESEDWRHEVRDEDAPPPLFEGEEIAAVEGEALSDTRAGFVTPNGIEFSIGFDFQTFVNGLLEAHNTFFMDSLDDGLPGEMMHFIQGPNGTGTSIFTVINQAGASTIVTNTQSSVEVSQNNTLTINILNNEVFQFFNAPLRVGAGPGLSNMMKDALVAPIATR